MVIQVPRVQQHQRICIQRSDIRILRQVFVSLFHSGRVDLVQAVPGEICIFSIPCIDGVDERFFFWRIKIGQVCRLACRGERIGWGVVFKIVDIRTEGKCQRPPAHGALRVQLSYFSKGGPGLDDVEGIVHADALVEIKLCAVAAGFVKAYNTFSDQSNYVAVYWDSGTDSINLLPGPNWFLYDSKVDSIKSLKAINNEEKQALLKLAPDSVQSLNSFIQAIDRLAFESNRLHQNIYYTILLIAAICGALGVQLRSMNNFIGVACYKNNFDFRIWWPWYLMRPFLGVLIGPILFILFEGKLMPLTTSSTYSNVLLIAICILAGFGSEDFLFMLRNLSKRVFGSKKSDT